MGPVALTAVGLDLAGGKRVADVEVTCDGRPCPARHEFRDGRAEITLSEAVTIPSGGELRVQIKLA